MRSEGYKTKTGMMILSFLEENKDTAVSVHDISEFFSQKGECPNVSTIYRQLEKLMEQKKVMAHSAEDGKKSLYQYITNDNHCMNHLHIQCTGCSKIVHLDCCESEGFTSHISEEHGILLDYSRTVLYGLCDDCRRNV